MSSKSDAYLSMLDMKPTFLQKKTYILLLYQKCNIVKISTFFSRKGVRGPCSSCQRYQQVHRCLPPPPTDVCILWCSYSTDMSRELLFAARGEEASRRQRDDALGASVPIFRLRVVWEMGMYVGCYLAFFAVDNGCRCRGERSSVHGQNSPREGLSGRLGPAVTLYLPRETWKKRKRTVAFTSVLLDKLQHSHFFIFPDHFTWLTRAVEATY